jgi:hypothetical protein
MNMKNSNAGLVTQYGWGCSSIAVQARLEITKQQSQDPTWGDNWVLQVKQLVKNDCILSWELSMMEKLLYICFQLDNESKVENLCRQVTPKLL